jgi:hypothetical protein
MGGCGLQRRQLAPGSERGVSPAVVVVRGVDSCLSRRRQAELAIAVVPTGEHAWMSPVVPAGKDQPAEGTSLASTREEIDPECAIRLPCAPRRAGTHELQYSSAGHHQRFEGNSSSLMVHIAPSLRSVRLACGWQERAFWKLHKRLHTHCTLDLVQADWKKKARICGGLCRASPLTDSNRRPLLTMERLRQLVATNGNGFRLSEPFSAPSLLLPVATGCDRWAP